VSVALFNTANRSEYAADVLFEFLAVFRVIPLVDAMAAGFE
jgi:hypothetical protein